MASFVRFSALIALATAVVATPPACLLACVSQVEKASKCSGLNDLSCICGDNSSAVEKCLKEICPNDNSSDAISAFENSCQGYLSQSSSSSAAPSSSASSSAPSSSASASVTSESSAPASSAPASSESAESSAPASSAPASSAPVSSAPASSAPASSAPVSSAPASSAPASSVEPASSTVKTETTSSSGAPSEPSVTVAPGAAANLQLSYGAAVVGLAGIALL